MVREGNRYYRLNLPEGDEGPCTEDRNSPEWVYLQQIGMTPDDSIGPAAEGYFMFRVLRAPRPTKLMVLAIKFDAMVLECVVKDHPELVRLGHVTRARMSQIMSLLNLASDL